jgi:hypothetical protein
METMNPLSCAELLQQTVFDLSTTFGRLLQSAAKLNEDPDRYRGASGWSHSTSDESLQRIARRDRHRRAFDDWLSLTIARQLTDVNNFLALQNEEQRRLIIKWLGAGGYTQLPPSNTWAPDLDLFLNDMNVVVLLLQAAE